MSDTASTQAAHAQAIQDGIADAARRESEMGLDVAAQPYFAPRLLGASAPHDCQIWSTQTIGDPDGRAGEKTVIDQLTTLLDLGLTVPPPR